MSILAWVYMGYQHDAVHWDPNALQQTLLGDDTNRRHAEIEGVFGIRGRGHLQ